MTKQSTNNLAKKFPKLDAQVVGIAALSLVLLVGLISAWQRFEQKLSPIEPQGQGLTTQLRVSDHSGSVSGSNQALLPNSLSDGTTPNYQEPATLEIPRLTNGQIPNLFRLQAEVVYK